jgi:hypothetical protein
MSEDLVSGNFENLRRLAALDHYERLARSAKVGSPMTSCQASTGNWLVISVINSERI